MLTVRPSVQACSCYENKGLYQCFTLGVCLCEFIGNNIRVNNYCKGVCIVQASKCIIVTQYISVNLPKQRSAL